jgi:hypothetical protein
MPMPSPGSAPTRTWGPADADTAALALIEADRILTLGAGKWRQHARDPELPLTVVEIADPGQARSKAENG